MQARRKRNERATRIQRIVESKNSPFPPLQNDTKAMERSINAEVDTLRGERELGRGKGEGEMSGVDEDV
jgi:hypothetical protein